MEGDFTGRDRITVEKDGEEIDVFNHVSVENHHYVNSVNGYETFEPRIYDGDNPTQPPEVITERVADLLWAEWGIEAEDHGIDVIDPSDEDATVV